MEARGLEPLTSGLQSPRSAKLSYAPAEISNYQFKFSIGWWAWVDLNYWPHAYQACALTNWATGPPVHFCRKIKPLGLWVKWLYEVWLTACSYCWRFAEFIAANELLLKYQFYFSISNLFRNSKDVALSFQYFTIPVFYYSLFERYLKTR